MPTPAALTPITELPLDTMDATLLTLGLLDSDDAHAGPLPAAIRIAATVHRTDTRPTGRSTEPYIAHPLRNALRLKQYGCTDQDVLTATVLHDTVEDHAVELVALAGGTPDAATAREQALTAITDWFGAEVARIVGAVSNPPNPPGLDTAEKHARYAAHVAAVVDDPSVLLVKFSDYADNAGSLDALTDPAKRGKLARKYTPLVAIFDAALDRSHGAGLPADGVLAMRTELARISDVLAASAT